jgi:hypothetical protein
MKPCRTKREWRNKVALELQEMERVIIQIVEQEHRDAADHRRPTRVQDVPKGSDVCGRDLLQAMAGVWAAWILDWPTRRKHGPDDLGAWSRGRCKAERRAAVARGKKR